MDVRCPGCQAEFSEWAPRCPRCGGPADATCYVPEARTRRRRRLIWVLPVGPVLLAVLGLLAVGHGRGDPTGAGARSFPRGLASETLFVGGSVPEIVHADGSVVRRFPRLRVSGYPDQPVGGTGGLVAFMSPDGHAMLIGSHTDEIQDLGRATAVVSAPTGLIGVQQQVTRRRTVLRDVAARGLTATGLSAPTWAEDLSQIGDALVSNTGSQVRVSTRRHSLALGEVGVVGAGGQVLAWTQACGPSSPGCRLHWLHVVDDRAQDAGAPDDTDGFAQGGAVDDSGGTIASFVYPEHDPGRLRLALVDSRTGAVSVVGPDLAVGAPIGSAAWSLDGHWVYFCGSAGPLLAERVIDGVPSGGPVTLPLPASYSLAGL